MERELDHEGVGWNRYTAFVWLRRRGFCEHGIERLETIKCWEFHGSVISYLLLENSSAQRI
jgi:hypothetical protein